jgi:tRNA1Val (adenine37-N6)-methyltransferase
MERTDDLQHNGLVLYQDTDYPRFNADALLLTRFLRLTKRDNAVELGSGTGVICVLGADNTGARFTGVEQEERLVSLAQKSAATNGQEIRFLCADVADAPQLLGRGEFSAVVMNPPYFTSGDESPNPSRCAARHDAGDTLGVFLKAAFALLKNGGRLFLIYPADALSALLTALKSERLEPKRIRLVYATKEANALRVLVEARKLAKSGLIIEPPAYMGDL